MKIHNSWYYSFTNPLDIGTRVAFASSAVCVSLGEEVNSN